MNETFTGDGEGDGVSGAVTEGDGATETDGVADNDSVGEGDGVGCALQADNTIKIHTSRNDNIFFIRKPLIELKFPMLIIMNVCRFCQVLEYLLKYYLRYGSHIMIENLFFFEGSKTYAKGRRNKKNRRQTAPGRH